MRAGTLVLAAAAALPVPAVAAVAGDVGAGGGAAQDCSRPEAIDPRDPGALEFLDADLTPYRDQAMAAHRAGRFDDAARLYLFVLRRRSTDPTLLYNLACAYARLGDGRRAAVALRHAVDAGFDDLATLEGDPDFKPVYGDFFFAEAFTYARSRARLAGERLLVAARMMAPARLHLPRDHSSKRPTDLVVALHGYGATCEGLAAVWALFEEPRFILVAPESPYPRPLGLDPLPQGYTWGLPTRDRSEWELADPLVAENLKAVVAAVAEKHKVKDVYLLGHSQGGAFATMAALASPDAFRGVIVLAGSTPEDPAIARALTAAAGKVRFFLAYGRRDTQVPLAKGIELRDRLLRAGFDVTWVEHDGDHGVSPEALRRAQQWMAEPGAGGAPVKPRG